MDQCLVWVYGLFSDKPGDFVKKPANLHPVPVLKPGRIQNPAVFAVQRAV